MTGIRPLTGIGSCATSLSPAVLANAFVLAASLLVPLRAEAGQLLPARSLEAVQASASPAGAAMDAVRAQQRWLPLREALRLIRQEPREVLLFAHQRDRRCADELRQKLAGHGYRFDAVLAAEGSAPILELLRAVRSQPTVPPTVVVLSGSADISAATSLPKYALVLDEIILSQSSHGARIPTIVFAAPPAASEAARAYRAHMFGAAREYGALLVDLTGTPSPEAIGDELAQFVLAAAAPHPSLFLLPLFPILSLAILWLYRRSRLRPA